MKNKQNDMHDEDLNQWPTVLLYDTTYHYAEKLDANVFNNGHFYHYVCLFTMWQHMVGLGDKNIRTVDLSIFNSELKLVTDISSSYELWFW